jgi:hypothetical protein
VSGRQLRELLPRYAGQRLRRDPAVRVYFTTTIPTAEAVFRGGFTDLYAVGETPLPEPGLD